MDSSLKVKLKRFIVATIIIIPLLAGAIWLLFPEPKLMMVNESAYAVLRLEKQTGKDSVLEDTIHIASTYASLEGVDSDLAPWYEDLVFYANQGQETLQFVFDHSLFLTNSKQVKSNLNKFETSYENLMDAYHAAENFLTNNFKLHLSSNGVTGYTVNNYFVTYRNYFSSYVKALAEFNLRALETINESTTMTTAINPLSLGLFNVKASYELLLVQERVKESPMADFLVVDAQYKNFVELDVFAYSTSVYFENMNLYKDFWEVSRLSLLTELLSVYGTARQAEFIAATEANMAEKINRFVSALGGLN